MMARTVHTLIFLAVSLTPVLGQVPNRSHVGGLAGAPLRMGFGARGIGMGNAFTAVNLGDLSSYYNPALVPFQIRPFATAAYGVLSLDRRLNFLNYTQHLKPSAGISFGIINAGVSDIEGRDRDGVPTETYSTSENAFFFSFGLKLDNQFSLGVTGKLLYYSLFEGLSSSTFGMDFGILYQLTDEIAIGGVIQDINSKYIWDTSKLYGRLGNTMTSDFPLRRKLAISYSASNAGFILASEVEFVSSETLLRVGSEVSMGHGFHIRAGIDQVSLVSNMNSKPSFGFSFQPSEVSWNPGFHYTYVLEPFTTAGIHVLSVSITFE